MRRWIAPALAGVLLCAAAGSAAAQQAPPSKEELRKKLDAELAGAWIKDGGWITDYDQARAEARKSGKLIAAYFTVSYFH